MVRSINPLRTLAQMAKPQLQPVEPVIEVAEAIESFADSDIDYSIPPPSAVERQAYDFDSWGVGGSKLVSAEEKTKFRSAAGSYAKRHGWKFTSRLQEDGSLRVWRIA